PPPIRATSANAYENLWADSTRVGCRQNSVRRSRRWYPRSSNAEQCPWRCAGWAPNSRHLRGPFPRNKSTGLPNLRRAGSLPGLSRRGPLSLLLPPGLEETKAAETEVAHL